MRSTAVPPFFGIGRYELDPTVTPAVLHGIYCMGEQAVGGRDLFRRIEFRSTAGAAGFVGRFTGSDPACEGELELEVVARGEAFDLVVHRGDDVVARGLGMPDPETDRAMLVSWWTGEQRPTGIVKYQISEVEPGVIDAVYTSIMVEMLKFDHLLTGRAEGDTTGGFPGHYTILYQGVDGETFGPYAWNIVERGDVLLLTWRQEGAMVLRGFGITDPTSPRSIIVNYWKATD
jgi:hypothetical protein